MATASLTISADTGDGIREYVAIALDVLDELGIHYELTSMATNMEGDVATLCHALTLIHERCHAHGAVRVGSLLKIDDRIDTAQTLASKIQHVQAYRARASAKG
ncbi:MTH1187 family thiamine-binding protein [bacterium]|nr:MAG: MTH1187 family thiamine-binding protein [bacterium]